MKVNNGDLNKLHITGYDAFKRLHMAGFKNPGSASTTIYSKPYSPVDKFNISIKRDPTLYPTFKYQALWNNWNHDIIATSFTQDVEEVYHKAYVP